METNETEWMQGIFIEKVKYLMTTANMTEVQAKNEMKRIFNVAVNKMVSYVPPCPERFDDEGLF